MEHNSTYSLMMGNFNCLESLSSLPPSLKCHRLKMFLHNCFKEHREKQTFLLSHFEVLFDLLAMLELRTLDGPTLMPSSGTPLNLAQMMASK